MILQSLLAKWFHHWKWLHLALAASVAPMVLTYLFVDESVRWLAIKGQLKEARRVISKMAAMNRRQIPDTSILELIAEEEQAEGDRAKNYTYRDLFKTLDLTKKTVVTCFSWFSLSIIYYGIYFGVKELSGDLYLNMLLMALTELPLTPILPLISIRCGRRAVTMIGLLLTSGACFGLAVCTRYIREQERGTYINALANTAKLTASISWCAIMTFGAEQFPTVIRNQAYAAQCTAARVGGLFAAQVLSLGGNDDLMVPFLAMGILSFLTTLMFLPLEETRGKPLQDTMKTFTAEKHKHALPRETVSHEMAVLIYQTKTEK